MSIVLNKNFIISIKIFSKRVLTSPFLRAKVNHKSVKRQENGDENKSY